MRKTIIAACSGILLLASAVPAAAQDIMIWRPTTAAGGAPVNPDFWNDQAAVRKTGAGAVQNNITLAPTNSTSTYNDYSENTNTTNVAGGQTLVNTQATLTNGGTYSVTTDGDPSFDGDQNNNSTTSTVTASMGDNSSFTTSTNPPMGD